MQHEGYSALYPYKRLFRRLLSRSESGSTGRSITLWCSALIYIPRMMLKSCNAKSIFNGCTTLSFKSQSNEAWYRRGPEAVCQRNALRRQKKTAVFSRSTQIYTIKPHHACPDSNRTLSHAIATPHGACGSGCWRHGLFDHRPCGRHHPRRRDRSAYPLLR